MSSNRIKNIAITGATGHVGQHITRALLATGQHTITALTRGTNNNSALPSGVKPAIVDYTSHTSLVSALRGQDVLIITLAGTAAPSVDAALAAAAGEAQVPWVIPNEWCPDFTDERLVRDCPWFSKKPELRAQVLDNGFSSFIGVNTGFWYEYMLAIPAAYGFEFEARKVTMFGGDNKVSHSTWPQVGRAVAALMGLPVKAEAGDAERCLENFKNKGVIVSSFAPSQRDMFESVLRVTGTKENEWTITEQDPVERLRQGTEGMEKGNYAEAPKVSARVFYPDGLGYVEDRASNKLLGLEREDLDEATKVAIERSKAPYA